LKLQLENCFKLKRNIRNEEDMPLSRFIFIAVFVFLSILGCGQKNNSSKNGGQIGERKLKIVTTTGMIADAVRNIGGDRVDVVALMGPGVDPHLYKASAGDVSRMAQADIIFYNGLHLEGKMTEVFEQMERRIKTVAVTAEIDPEKLISPPEFQGAHDPHVWFDVELWSNAAWYIAKTLADFDTLNRSIYQENGDIYLEKLNQLHQFVLKRANELPSQRRILITAHDAFNYFGRAYGFQVRGLQGISTAAEAGTADVQNLANFIVQQKVPAIFVETSVPPRYIEALKEAVESRNHMVQIGGNLYSDALGDATSPEGTYIGMVTRSLIS
jgi:manganese/zinc/iron transport system substrate-binding protein